QLGHFSVSYCLLEELLPDVWLVPWGYFLISVTRIFPRLAGAPSTWRWNRSVEPRPVLNIARVGREGRRGSPVPRQYPGRERLYGLRLESWIDGERSRAWSVPRRDGQVPDESIVR